jgi:hypothetical protein
MIAVPEVRGRIEDEAWFGCEPMPIVARDDHQGHSLHEELPATVEMRVSGQDLTSSIGLLTRRWRSRPWLSIPAEREDLGEGCGRGAMRPHPRG